jgi:hypothetical protein
MIASRMTSRANMLLTYPYGNKSRHGLVYGVRFAEEQRRNKARDAEQQV